MNINCLRQVSTLSHGIGKKCKPAPLWPGLGRCRRAAGAALSEGPPQGSVPVSTTDSCRLCVWLSRESSGGLNRKTKTKEHVIIMYALLQPTLILASVLGQICWFSQTPY